MDKRARIRQARREREKLIVRRIHRLLKAGWSMRQVALVEGMPSLRTLRRWVRKDHLGLRIRYHEQLDERFLEDMRKYDIKLAVLDEIDRLFGVYGVTVEQTDPEKTDQQLCHRDGDKAWPTAQS